MAQNAERVFFDEVGIYISQIRFTTPEGDTFRTSALRRSFLSEEREGGCRTTLVGALYGCLALAGGISLIICVRAIIFAAIRMAAADGLESAFDQMEGQPAGEVSESILGIVDTTWANYGWVVPLAVFGLVALGIGVWGSIRTLRGRRRRYIAVFMFGPGGPGATTTRNEYVFRDYDGEMMRRLIASANDAILAAQQTQAR